MSRDHAERRAFGEAVRSWRLERGASLDAVAAQIGVHRTTLWRFEQGTHAPDLFQARRLAAALDVTLAELLSGVGADRVYGVRA